MVQNIVLGIIQGVAEWLPVSSEGLIILVGSNFFGLTSLGEAVRLALFLHLGTFLAALIYFRKDVKKILGALFYWPGSTEETRKVLIFLLVATFISGILGLSLLKFLEGIESEFIFTSKIITLGIGFLLVLTGFLQIKAKRRGTKSVTGLKLLDGIILGFVQGIAALPGLSRSGLTVSTLLLKNFNGRDALRLSFLLSLPVVLGGNIVLNLDKFLLDVNAFLGLLFSFVFGLLTIHVLIKLAGKLNFGKFILIFGFLTILAGLI